MGSAATDTAATDSAAEHPEEFEVTVGPMAHGGHCVARHEGRVIFVRHAVPGERVRVRVQDPQASAKFWRGDVIAVLEPSEHRRRHVWKLADALRAYQADRLPVGGAEYGHMTDQHQRWTKAQVFRDTLQRVGGISVHEVASTGALSEGELHVADPDDYARHRGRRDAAADSTTGMHWRTRVSFAVNGAGALCMTPHRSHELIELRGMPLAVQAINSSALFRQDFTGAQTVDVIAAGAQAPLALVVRPAAADRGDSAHSDLTERLVAMAQEDERLGTVLLAPPAAAPRSRSPRGPRTGRRGRARAQGRKRSTEGQSAPQQPPTLLAGPRSVAEPLPAGQGGGARHGGGVLALRPESFWQIHRSAPEALVQTVESLAPLQGGESVADLYAGAGLFTAWAADRVGAGGRVLSVEAAGASAASAAEYFHGDDRVILRQSPVEHMLAELPGHDVVLLDPPRAGAGARVIAGIDEAAPRRIVYVSCDPASFARDAAELLRRGWQFRDLRILDLYPNTHHMESVAVFER
ncbi:class I SAM-dependent RNA methyltransferase [Nesterenkonia aerolata]|uniref:TRAM domain-containing protein n=1 Tax=Nesterenkonia aerolata TaxID=3074079 RepID=A0ABU2DRL0_9MICC|nr:TRAM domain-containing protein [Nesterenkonia sp. LY-0111]MDR8019109.1 TRAM domain-containing protein [Nesterenkonia sp. LY-0111]